MEYATKGGDTLSDQDIERLGEAAEQGDYPGTPGDWIIRPQGRAAPSDEDLVTIAVRMPGSQKDAIDLAALARHQTRSAFIPEVLSNAV